MLRTGSHGRWPGLLIRAFCAGVWLLAAAAPLTRAGEDWLPITQEDLTLKDNPAYPGAPAMILYREQRTDDIQNFDTFYERIKIFTEEGKKHGDIEIPYLHEAFKISDIRARTVHPDGTVVNFSGQIFEKLVAKARGVKVQEKTFSLPDVTVGSIVEYRYKTSWDPEALYNTNWYIQDELFTRKAIFALRPYNEMQLYWLNARLPRGVSAAEGKDHVVHLEVENIPPLPVEELMPPESQYKMGVHFYYTRTQFKTADEYWKQEAKTWYSATDQFIGKRKGVEQAALQAVSANDPPEAKLRKLYARVQQIRNLSAEHTKTEQEQQRAKQKSNDNAEDILKHGYGYARQLNWLFCGMARAAGFDASVVLVAGRNEYVFNQNLLDMHQFNGDVVLVHLADRDLFLDPGAPFAPFGLLTWPETGVRGMKLTKDGPVWVTTPAPLNSQAMVDRRATLTLDEAGNLRGDVQVAFTGHEALRLRQEAIEQDETGRNKLIEDRLKEWLPAGVTITLNKVSGWQGVEEPLRVESTIKAPGVAIPTGRRLLLTPGIFESGVKNPFQHANRIYPVLFAFPYRQVDDITLKLPAGFQLEDLPPAHNLDDAVGTYQVTRERMPGGGLHVVRRLALKQFYLPVDWYSPLRAFFTNVKAGDDEQVVLQLAQRSER